MELILWRHAEAEEGAPDRVRELTKKGLRQAKKVAGWLKGRLPAQTHVIASPTRRTQQTAMALGCDFETSEIIAPGANAKKILAAIDWPNRDGAVLLVGHQPTLGEVAALLIARHQLDLSIKKGAVWWFSGKKAPGIEKTILRAVISPDML